MLWTFLVGNGLYAASVYAFWMYSGGDRAKFMPAFFFATGTFVAGVITGIIANMPAKVKRKPQHKGSVSASAAAAAFDTLEAQPSAADALGTMVE